MQLRYAFFAGDVQERPDGQYEFLEIANGRQVAAFPSDITVACVLVIERTSAANVAGMDVGVQVLAPPARGVAAQDVRVATRCSVRAPRRGSMPGYEYVPVDVQFTACRPGPYEIHVERGGVVWYVGYYRVELKRNRQVP